MKNALLLCLLSALLLFTACDRYDQDYIVIPTANAFVDNFNNMVPNALANNNISQVMSYYSPNYMNGGKSKSDMQNFYTKDWSDSVMVEITVLNADRLKYQLRIKDNGRSVDTTWVDFAKKIGSGFYWIGNQQGAPAIPKQKALLQVLTGTWCPNCPQAEAALHNIYQNIPNQMVYLEYHINDTLAVSGTSNMAAYYGVQSAPTVIFQGKTIVSGTSNDALNSYQPIINGIITSDTEILLSNLTYTKNGNNLTGSVNITTLGDTNLENCYLKAVIYEKETTALNYEQEPCGNVVRAQTTVNLNAKAFRQSVDFEMTSTKGIANDAYVVVWVQKIANVNLFNETTDKILNCIESQIR